jgi:hypothetical protein
MAGLSPEIRILYAFHVLEKIKKEIQSMQLNDCSKIEKKENSNQRNKQ